MAADVRVEKGPERRVAKRDRIGAYGWQMVLRTVPIVGYVAYLSADEWTWTDWLVTGTVVTGMLLVAAGAAGVFGIWRRTDPMDHWLLRAGDAIVDLLAGGTLIATTFTVPRLGPLVFAVWAIVAGLLLTLHAVPSRLRDRGPSWAWLWTGLPLIATGIYLLIVRVYFSATGYLWLNAYALAAGTMSAILGFGARHRGILAMPWQESSGETMFAYDDIHWRRTPPDLERMHDWDEPPRADQHEPKSGEAA